MKLYNVLSFLVRKRDFLLHIPKHDFFNQVFCSSVSAQAMQACSSENRDCSCKDVSYEICHTPPVSQELHVADLEECIQNCDVSSV